jgi:hypothetical protein
MLPLFLSVHSQSVVQSIASSLWPGRIYCANAASDPPLNTRILPTATCSKPERFALFLRHSLSHPAIERRERRRLAVHINRKALWKQDRRPRVLPTRAVKRQGGDAPPNNLTSASKRPDHRDQD